MAFSIYSFIILSPSLAIFFMLSSFCKSILQFTSFITALTEMSKLILNLLSLKSKLVLVSEFSVFKII